jgi:L-ascorbate metabolism protein UlaG (beta-lactamase superfamily)
MSVQIRFFGVAAYEVITSTGQHILIDPFLDANPGSPVKADQLDQVDLIIVTHAAFDHFGDTEKIARRTGAPIICGGELKAFLMAKGIPAAQIRATTWGIRVEVAGVEVQPVECRHWSQIQMPDGALATGNPMAFVIDAGPNVRFYHYGDTAIFSDLKLIAELYQPTIGAIGVSQPWEITHLVTGPGRMLTGEMSAREGALAAQWLGLEVVLPCHYINPDNDDVREFNSHLDNARAQGQRVPQSVVMKPGDVYTVP